ncbi:DUF167 domain-containing protein [candidate division TA06 bacterium]|uniref:DUF167 domain-containing protein n=1 Tax=candidate division TA06 bacterium TaxID=2250710 RepID=A0A933MK88_UNCT6|nr:DUF167 domain-containing protein [candidate division TA06 bacterium]
MILNIKVVSNAKQEKMVKEDQRYKVYLCAPAVESKANQKLVEFLAAHFKVKKSAVAILRGQTSRLKIVEIKTE